AMGEADEAVFAPADNAQLHLDRLQGLRVMVIDDDASVRQAMLQLLENWGCDCRTAEHVEEALEQLEAWTPQLLISDYRLRENQTGAQAVYQLRQKLGTRVPALIITGDTAPQRLHEARAT